jgi:hypothetical protein
MSDNSAWWTMTCLKACDSSKFYVRIFQLQLQVFVKSKNQAFDDKLEAAFANDTFNL